MYCRIHETNNCLECAIDAQTREIVKAINSHNSDQMDAGRIQEPQAYRSDKPCLLCRIIGHKWVLSRRVKSWGDECSQLIILGCCTRCGEPTPPALLDFYDPTDYELATRSQTGVKP
jgi:hypothetical protein